MKNTNTNRKRIRSLPWPPTLLRAQALTTLDTYKVGRLLSERVVGKDGKSIRKAQGALPEVSVSTLLRCIQVYRTCRSLGTVPRWKRVHSGHLFRLTTLPRQKQQALVAKVEKEGWTVTRLQHEVDKLAPNRTRGGRRPLPGFVKTLRNLSKAPVLDGLELAEKLDPNEVNRLVKQATESINRLEELRSSLSRLQASP